jgi:NAD(P)-dependent dehydrogenase (short-subunit alcohol dehydrogenase family)
MELKGSTFIVTGGASGLGAATARMIVAGGGNVVLADVNAEVGKALATELGRTAHFVKTDVTDEVSGKAAVAATMDGFGGLQGLVNCAGIVHGEKVVGKQGPHTLAGFARSININLIGSFNLTRLAADAMSKGAPNTEGERGVIVYTASIAAFDGQIGQAAYSASKAGLVGMTLPIARELARYGIRVMTIAPGVFETPMVGQIPPDIAAALGKAVPFPPRLGRPAEFASLVGEIIRNPMLNGEVIRLDGAIRMAPKSRRAPSYQVARDLIKASLLAFDQCKRDDGHGDEEHERPAGNGEPHEFPTRFSAFAAAGKDLLQYIQERQRFQHVGNAHAAGRHLILWQRLNPDMPRGECSTATSDHQNQTGVDRRAEVSWIVDERH